jgi:hypothetical protein
MANGASDIEVRSHGGEKTNTKIDHHNEPKWMGSTPSLSRRGRKIGVKIMIAGPISTKHPTIRRNIFTRSNSMLF